MTLQIGFVLFPGIQQLDLTGPYDVLGSLPDVKLHLVWKDLAPVTSSTGLVFTPTMTYADCPTLDVICVPGGSGVGALMEDPQTLDFLKAQAQTARYVTSVCTGSLVLGAAGGVGHVALGQRAADVDALGEQEGVGHAAADGQAVQLADQVFQEVQLGRDLGPADDTDDRLLRIAEGGVQSVQLAAHGFAGVGGDVVCDPFGRGVGAVCGREGIVDRDRCIMWNFELL